MSGTPRVSFYGTVLVTGGEVNQIALEDGGRIQIFTSEPLYDLSTEGTDAEKIAQIQDAVQQLGGLMLVIRRGVDSSWVVDCAASAMGGVRPPGRAWLYSKRAYLGSIRGPAR